MTTVATLQQFEHDVFLGEATPDVAAAPRDLDGDGVIDATGKKPLDEVAAVLERKPKLRVQLVGHTDSTASEPHNQTVSDRRAEATRSDLVATGTASSRLEAKGWSGSQPATENTTAAVRATNRPPSWMRSTSVG